MPREQIHIGERVPALHQAPEVLGLDNPRQAELLGPPAVPNPGRFPGAHEVVLHAIGDRPQ